MLDLRNWFQVGRGIRVKSGGQTRFWLDPWLGEIPLKVEFWELFEICADPDILVAKIWRNGEWLISFRRTLDEHLLEEWMKLQTKLSEVELTVGNDEVFWDLESTGKYNPRSLYRFMTFRGVKNLRLDEIWKCRVPLNRFSPRF